jgi:hypothetical protein
MLDGRAWIRWWAPALALCAAAPVARAQCGSTELLPSLPTAGYPLRLETLCDIGPSRVFDLANAGDGSGRLFLVTPQGVIRIFKNGAVRSTPFLNAPAFPADRGMTSLAFHPGFPANGKLYVITGEVTNPNPPHYAPPQIDTGGAFDNVLYEYRVDPVNPDRVDPLTRRELLRLHQAERGHNMNDMTFGGDGFLYIASGDGGNTRQGSPTNYNTNAQQTTNPYGKVLRIDVDHVGPNGRYAIPTDNPFANGADGNVPEIFAWGLRNPWRITSDRLTGVVYTGVVGDNSIEQIDRVERGKNYGWDAKEGAFLWNPTTGAATPDPNPDPRYSPPLGEYDHEGTPCRGSVIGGYVYRGSGLPGVFYGKYLFNDWVSGELMQMDPSDGAVAVVPIDPTGAFVASQNDVTWGEDEGGELYIGRLSGDVMRFTLGVTAVADPRGSRRARLLGSEPNPSRGPNRIGFELSREEQVTLTVFDLAGRAVARLVDGRLPAGRHWVTWDRAPLGDADPASGVFSVVLEIPGLRLSRRIVRLE